MTSSKFRLVSRYVKPSRGRFTLANGQLRPKTRPKGGHRLIVWQNSAQKPEKEVKIIVDSFYTNGTFDYRKYQQWQRRIVHQIKTRRPAVELNNQQRSEIRSKLFWRTQADLRDIQFD